MNSSSFKFNKIETVSSASPKTIESIVTQSPAPGIKGANTIETVLSPKTIEPMVAQSSELDIKGAEDAEVACLFRFLGRMEDVLFFGF